MSGSKKLFAIILAIAAFGESYIPYWYAGEHAGTDHVFLGQVAYPADQHMYFSFISQARQGHWIFDNKLTFLPNRPAFFNVEFLVVGLVQRLLDLSENAVFQLWRFIGVVVLSVSFYMLAVLALPNVRRAAVATAVFLFTGGFGFTFVILSGSHLIPPNIAEPGTIDMRYGLLPFQQVLTNPHFSLPHGLILLAYALFLLAEREARLRYYAASGAVFMLVGLVRPYDIIPPLTILPLFLLIDRSRSKRPLVNGLLPLVMILPVLCYDIWLFQIHPIFSYWAHQGLNAGFMPGPFWHYLAYGVVGIIAIWRILQVKRNPFTTCDCFLVIWFLVTFILVQAGRYIPLLGWSPQFATNLAAPLVLLGFSVKTNKLRESKLLYRSAIAGLVILTAAGNLSTVAYFIRRVTDRRQDPLYYATKDEFRAWQWMSRHLNEKEVVLALPASSLSIAKYTSASVVAAHYSVSPRFWELYGIVKETLMHLDETIRLNKLNVAYVYVGPPEKPLVDTHPFGNGCLKPVYNDASVSIYAVPH